MSRVAGNAVAEIGDFTVAENQHPKTRLQHRGSRGGGNNPQNPFIMESSKAGKGFFFTGSVTVNVPLWALVRFDISYKVFRA